MTDEQEFEPERVRRALRDGGRPRPRRLVSSCCRAEVTLHGTPAPQYHCTECGRVLTRLGELVLK